MTIGVNAKQLEKRRFRALDLLAAGRSPTAVAEMLGVSRQSVHNWKKAASEGGRRAVAATPRYSPSCQLSNEQQQELLELLRAGPRAAGFDQDLWTGPRIRDLIEQRFGISYHRGHVPRLLRELGWTPQKPDIRAREQDPEAAERWRQRDWPRVKKGRRSKS